jgi:hypothetical protein
MFERRTEFDLADTPGLPTVKSWVSDLTRGADGPRWDPWAADATEVQRRRLARVVAWKASTAVRPDDRWLTHDEARWVDRVASVLPDEAPGTLYRVARAYIESADDPAAVATIDLELMFHASHPDADIHEVMTWKGHGASRVVSLARTYLLHPEQLMPDGTPRRRLFMYEGDVPQAGVETDEVDTNDEASE